MSRPIKNFVFGILMEIGFGIFLLLAQLLLAYVFSLSL